MHPWEHSRASRLGGPLGLTSLTIAGVIALSCVGLMPGTDRWLGPFSALSLLLYAGSIAGAYLLGAFGLGRPLAALLAPRSTNTLWIQLGLGLAAMLWLSHALGVLGLLSGPGMRPRAIGWGAVGVGALLAADQVVRGPLRPERWPVIPASAMLWAPGLALLAVAASNPPGGVWSSGSSEFGAFDALSYHLQLPKEWAAGTRVWPTDHNVYSYLPSLVEAAYLHLGTMMVGSPNVADPVDRMLGGEGNWVIACQYLHAGLAALGSLLTARAAWMLARRCDAPERSATALGIVAGAFVLCTPWVLVTSSLPYNEAGMLALGAAGALIALDTDLAPWARGAAAGLAVGVACGCKPTALFMVGPLVGLLLVGHERMCRLPGLIGAGVVAGLSAIGPWLARNWLACGNPVFPFAPGIFGSGRWTPEQIERHARNHHAPPEVGVGERIGRLFSEDGLRHGQWGIALVVVALALAAAIAWPKSRRAGVLLGLALAVQAACWMMLTHLQSRFLLPMLTTGSLLVALGGSGLVAWVGRSGRGAGAGGRMRGLATAAIVVLALAPLSQAVRSTTLFLEQNAGMPNRLLFLGVGVLTGLSGESSLASARASERAQVLADAGPIQYVNLGIRPQTTEDAGVYLLGDSTPLYYLGATGDEGGSGRASGSSPVVYATTWDTPLLARADEGGKRDPDRWSAYLRRRGIRYVLVNFEELHRLIDTSRYYDPSISMATVTDWIASPGSHLRSVRAWREPGMGALRGLELFEIDLPRPAESPAGSGVGGDRP
jgi:hypothetical protein